MIKIGLVEDQALVREGLETLLHLTSDIQVVGRCANAAGALRMIQEIGLDVILMDVRLPDMSGIDVLRRLAQLGIEARVIILTTFDDDAVLIEGLRLGAKGFLLKDVSLDVLTDAIRKVANGENMFGPHVSERLRRALQSVRIETITTIEESLSEREIEVLRLMTAGLNNAEIASTLFLSEGTVKNHVSKILGKLGVRDRVRAVLRGIQLGYVT